MRGVKRHFGAIWHNTAWIKMLMTKIIVLFDMVKIHCAFNPIGRMSVEFDFGDLFLDAGSELLAEPGNLFSIFFASLPEDSYRLGETDDPRGIFCPRPHPPFLMASVEERLEIRAFADVEGPDTLRTVDLVGRDREQVHAQIVNVDLQLAEYLYRIRMDKDIFFSGHSCYLLDGLDRPDLVVRLHDRDQGRPRGYCILEKI